MSKSLINIRQSKKRAVATAFLICFIVVHFSLQFFIITNINHKHDYNDTCAICVGLQNAEGLLKQLDITVAYIAFTLIILFSLCAIPKYIFSNIAAFTPVSLKTRMNN